MVDYKDLGGNYRFLAYPNQLKAFSFNSNEVEWKNGVTLDLATVILKSRVVEISEIKNEYITMGQENIAPTEQDKKHHVYYVTLYPFSDKPFMIGESIGGGHGERGGCTILTFEKLKETKSWKEHFKNSGCDWAVTVIEKPDAMVQEIIEELVNGIRSKSEFNQ